MATTSTGAAIFGLSLIVLIVVLVLVSWVLPDNFLQNTNGNMDVREIVKQQLVISGLQGVLIASLVGFLTGAAFSYISIKKEHTHNLVLYQLIKSNLIRLSNNQDHDIKVIIYAIQNMTLALTFKDNLEQKLLKLCHDFLMEEDYTKNKTAFNEVSRLITKLDEKIDGKIKFLGAWLGKK